MFGRLSQLAQNVQHSFNADEGGTQEHGSPSKNTGSSLTDHLQSQLEESEERNKSINHAFKKLLKEKEVGLFDLGYISFHSLWSIMYKFFPLRCEVFPQLPPPSFERDNKLGVLSLCREKAFYFLFG